MTVVPPREPQPVSSKPAMRVIKAVSSLTISVTPDCAIGTLIHFSGEAPEFKEHDSFKDAVEYINDHPDLVTGDWRRVEIINVGSYTNG